MASGGGLRYRRRLVTPALLTAFAVLAATPESDAFTMDKTICEKKARKWNGEIDKVIYVSCRRDRDAQAARAEKAALAKLAAEKEEADRKAAAAERMRLSSEAALAEQAKLAEEQRAAEADAANKAWIAERSKDDDFMRQVRSAQLCRVRAGKALALKEIEEEKKYARIGGVTNTEKLYALQVSIREADKQIAEGLALKPAPLLCALAEMKAYVTCFYEREADTYADTDSCRAVAAIVRYLASR